MDHFARVEAAARSGAIGNNGYTEPTQGQISAGNYKKGHVRLHGLPVVIENPRNSFREGTDSDGTAWRTRMAHHYGYFSGVKGADGDGLDVFIGPFPESENVYAINQVDPRTGDFDELKVMLGFPDRLSAQQGYKDSYSRDWKGMGNVVPCTIEQFKGWLKTGDTTKPLNAGDLPKDGNAIMDAMNTSLEGISRGVGISFLGVRGTLAALL